MCIRDRDDNIDHDYHDHHRDDINDHDNIMIIGMTICIMITKATLTLKNCRAALLTGYHPHVLGLQRAGVGR